MQRTLKKKVRRVITGVSIPGDLRTKMVRFRRVHYVNWSRVCAEAIERYIDEYPNKTERSNGRK